MKPFTVYEMTFSGAGMQTELPEMIPLRAEFDEQYLRIYNECFYEMRKVLDIRPYNVYADVRQLDTKRPHIFLLAEGKVLIGSVSCCGSEIDDLIVNPQYRGRGYGRRLLAWAVAHIREDTDAPVTLHVAGQNRIAVRLYLKSGFVITKTEQMQGTPADIFAPVEEPDKNSQISH